METKKSAEVTVSSEASGVPASDRAGDQGSVRLALAVYLGFAYLIAGSLWLGAHPSDSSLFSVQGVFRFLATIFGWPLFALGLLDV